MRHRLILLAILCGLVLLSHVSYLNLPFFWDELGQFVPAGLDILRDNAWVPKSTVPNVHPPGVMAYLALVWRVFGYSIAATRVAMLLWAGAGVWLTFLLAVRLSRHIPGVPAFQAIAFLLCAPLFFTQAMMAQLDMPAMVLTLASLLLFLDSRYLAAALACTVLVLVKETGALLPAVLGGWLFFIDKRRREAIYFAAPFLALAAWLAILYRSTGHIFGDASFAQYNVTYQLNGVRILITLARRIYYLFLAQGHLIGAFVVIMAVRRTRIFHHREWAIVGVFCALHIVAMSILGGAALERYLLPVLPLVYIAFAAGLAMWRPLLQWTGSMVLCGTLLVGLFWNPPYPFPYENNLAMVDFVELQRLAVEFLDNHAPGRTVATAWPLTGALRSPDFGYTRRGRQVLETSDFHAKHVLGVDPNKVQAAVVYMRTWEPPNGVLRWKWVEQFLRRYYDYEPQVTAEQLRDGLGLHPVLRLNQGGQFVEIYLKSPPDVAAPGGRQVARLQPEQLFEQR
jgi:4-amino-4-deoxy-L-arabinose transferase-like glycosyltransferase